jgi:hypothetical protein
MSEENKDKTKEVEDLEPKKDPKAGGALKPGSGGGGGGIKPEPIPPPGQ